MRLLGEPRQGDDGAWARVDGHAARADARLTCAVALHLRLQARITLAEAKIAREHHRAVLARRGR